MSEQSLLLGADVTVDDVHKYPFPLAHRDSQLSFFEINFSANHRETFVGRMSCQEIDLAF